jgi:hypothetical protein
MRGSFLCWTVLSSMAKLAGDLWDYNLARVVVVDVTDDYQLMQPPMPGDCYPVLYETYMPIYGLTKTLANSVSTEHFLYDWHESPMDGRSEWYVGVVEKARVTA